jgi:hypothetical protein
MSSPQINSAAALGSSAVVELAVAAAVAPVGGGVAARLLAQPASSPAASSTAVLEPSRLGDRGIAGSSFEELLVG